MPRRSRRRQPQVERIPITEHPGLAGEVIALRRLVSQQAEVVESLLREARSLRARLAAIRQEPPREWEPGDHLLFAPATAQELEEQVGVLRERFDELNEVADALWFETQWLRAQLAVVTGEFPFEGRIDDRAG